MRIGGGGGSRTRVRKRSAWNVYVRSHLGCSRRPPPKVAKKRPASPDVFASGPRAGPSAIPLCDAHPVPRGKKGPVDGLLKQPALTVSWRLVHFHLFYEEWASARCPSLNNPVETVSPPRFRSVVLGRTGNIAPGFPGGQGTARG